MHSFFMCFFFQWKWHQHLQWEWWTFWEQCSRDDWSWNRWFCRNSWQSRLSTWFQRQWLERKSFYQCLEVHTEDSFSCMEYPFQCTNLHWRWNHQCQRWLIGWTQAWKWHFRVSWVFFLWIHSNILGCFRKWWWYHPRLLHFRGCRHNWWMIWPYPASSHR